jgi:flagellin-like protein
MKKNILQKIKKDEKAISPVVATVIIVAVAIAVAIAVAYWVTGLVPAFTQYEELKILTTYIETNADSPTGGADDDKYGSAAIDVKNTGSSDVTIASILVNARVDLAATTSDWSMTVNGAPSTDYLLQPGDEGTITVWADDYPVGNFQTGVIYDFQVHSSGGGSYPTSARAP